MANGNTIHGKRKFYASLVFSCGVVLSITLLAWNGKIDDTAYSGGLTTAGLAMMAYFGANAVQKFANGGKDER